MAAAHSPNYGSDPATPNTTFVQADASNFRAVVQKLTGAPDDPSAQKLPLTLPARLAAANAHKTAADAFGHKKPNFKLQERRQAAKKLEVSIGVAEKPVLHGCSSLSPSPSSYGAYVIRSRGGAASFVVGCGISEKLMASPVSPLEAYQLARGSPRTPKEEEEEEERAIAEKGFYLHRSPLSTPRTSEPPELLPLFPLHSPRDKDVNSS